MTDPVTRKERIAFVSVSWDAYVALRELDENRGVSMTFREGRLEFVRPSFLHDRCAHLLRRVVHAWTEDSDVPIRTAGSPTLRNAELLVAAEPDESFYIRNEAAVRPFDVIDTSRQPCRIW
jgi:Uma2 family endonuclease